MDERLNKSNRLPGSEKLTRPEEIGQLSKYLKSIKEIYEENTRLEDQLVGVTGYSTGKIPKIDSLVEKTIKTPDNQGENVDLSRKILGVPGKRSEEEKGLEKKRVGLNDSRDTKLDDKTIKVPDNYGEEADRLGEVIKKIQDVRDQKLGDKRINLEDERLIALEDTRLDLQAMINASLENKRIDLKDDRLNGLEDKRVEIEDSRKVELGNKKLDLSDNRELTLSDTILKIDEPKETELEDKRLKIQDERKNNLEDKRLEIQDERENSLENKRIELSAKEDIGLGNKKIGIEDDREVELGKKRLSLSNTKQPELEDSLIGLNDDREIELGEKRLELKDDQTLKLEDIRINLRDDNEVKLSEKRVGLKDENESTLSDKIVKVTDERELVLSDKIIDLKDDLENELEDKRLKLEDSREVELGNKKLDLSDNRDTELSETRINIIDERDQSLSDKILNLLDNREPKLSDKILDLEDKRDAELSDKKIEIGDNRENELEDKKVKVAEDENGEPEELYNSLIGRPDNKNGEPTELYSSFIGMEENKGKNIDLTDIKSLKEYTSKLSDSELYEFAMGLTSEGKNASGEPDKWLEKMGSIISAYLSSDILLPKRAIDLREAINADNEVNYFGKLFNEYFGNDIRYEFRNGSSGESKDKYIERTAGIKSKPIPFPDSQSETVKDGDVENLKPQLENLPDSQSGNKKGKSGSLVNSLKSESLRVPVNTSCGTIWAQAEKDIGEQITGTNRRDALDEMIVKLVDYKKSNLPKLPGSSIGDALSGAVKNVSSLITGDTSHPNPMNKPLSLNGMAIPGGYGDAIYQAANNRTQITLDSDPIDVVGDTIGNAFFVRYWNAESFKATLEDLCPIVGKAPIASLTELKAILKSSPYFTSPGKFMTDSKGSYNTFSLDTNMYWEVTIEPYCCDNGPCSNGGFSFLPSIKEINFLNKELHGVSTNYGYWAPISGFELQKSKLSTKSLPLYDGEISYPTGMEFTNELRLTFVDDAWKSWKRYFERCADVSIYSSVAHNEAYYTTRGNTGVTRIDKTNICVAYYKNLAFNIKIYILNPQLNLINRFNLLCILKDYAEEYVGEIDSGGTDLNVTFSIVGENPEEDMTKKIKVSQDVITNLAQQALLETQKRVTGALNYSVGLL